MLLFWDHVIFNRIDALLAFVHRDWIADALLGRSSSDMNRDIVSMVVLLSSPILALAMPWHSSCAILLMTASGEVSSLNAVSMRNRSESSAAIGIPHDPASVLPYRYSFAALAGRYRVFLM